MYHVIEAEYVGPNPAEHRNAHAFAIQREPGSENLSGAPIAEGWLGQSGDWSRTAHGEFETLAVARDAIIALTPDGRRETDADAARGEIECYIADALEAYSPAESVDWAWEGFAADVAATATDDELDALADTYARSASEDWIELDVLAVAAAMREYRDSRSQYGDDAK